MVDDVATKCAVSPRARMMLSVDGIDPATVLIVYPAFTIRIALPDSDELAITKKSLDDTEAASVMSICVADFTMICSFLLAVVEDSASLHALAFVLIPSNFILSALLIKPAAA